MAKNITNSTTTEGREQHNIILEILRMLEKNVTKSLLHKNLNFNKISHNFLTTKLIIGWNIPHYANKLD